MKRIEMLSGLLAQLDEINEGVKDCLYTLQENAEITRMVINEIMNGAAEDPVEDQKLKMWTDKAKQEEEFNIFDEDFEKKILEKMDKTTSKLTKTTIQGLDGQPIDVFEVKIGEDMSMEDVAKELTSHLKNIQSIFDPTKKDQENNDDDHQLWT